MIIRFSIEEAKAANSQMMMIEDEEERRVGDAVIHLRNYSIEHIPPWMQE
jgi:hypothetical protein